MDSLMYLNVIFAGVDREFNLHLNDKDKLSIVYYPSRSNENKSTSQITVRELFDLIGFNARAKSLGTMALYERDLIKQLINENKTLKNEIGILKSAFKMIKKD